MFFGLTIEKLLLIGVIAALIIGPERLPRYAEGLAKFVGRSREWLRGAKTRVRDEMGPDFDDVDWRKLDPRQYDPRRIIREALLDDAPVAPVRMQPAPGFGAGDALSPDASKSDTDASSRRLEPGTRPPFDSEAT